MMTLTIKRLKTLSFLLISLVISVPAQAGNWSMPENPTEVGIETTVVSVLISNNSTGTITVKNCDECEPLQFRVTQESQFLRNGVVSGDIRQARSLNGKYAVVVYRVATLELVKIQELDLD